MSAPRRRIFEKDQFRPFRRAQRTLRRERSAFPSVFDQDQNTRSAHVIGCNHVMRRQDWRSTAVKRRWDADLKPVYRGSMAEGPAAVIPSAPEETPGWRTRVLRFSGSFPPQKMLRTRWVVLNSHQGQFRPKASDMR